MDTFLRSPNLHPSEHNKHQEAEQVVTHQPAISFSISLQFPFNRAGGRTSNVLQEMTLDHAFAELRRKSDTSAPIKLPLPTGAEVMAAENELGMSFHPDYRRFQLEVSDVDCGVFEPGLVLPNLQPYLDLRVIARDGWEAGVPSDSLPFCEDNGNYYFIDPSGTVRYWDHDCGGESGRRATFAEWILEDWLFDQEE